ncbi:benomyl/methotrexate resistance protein [Pyrenophora tritici-repentis Pt-1C-BFP]|uniref:Benomyl/methotrexate resistance protein n=1 Tax=Pyrenophora tritici-repentis (strain Pt-1C-BFP) TaxID=426418 RepID=B2W3H6_PYRTR|nr:benomyl/methotrexate resistance protein [Pyrenophora tritici-repentis Pt-1C-BFP]EDU47933.1 benomyl/methotrexate resistance protein [Pyrenophora tritici-repentis Pt-1C-BFP]
MQQSWSESSAASTRPPSPAEAEKSSDRSRQPSDSKSDSDPEKGLQSPAHDTAPNSPVPSPQDRPTSLDWDGPDDPLNPHNWSLTRKWYQTFTISGIALVGTFASSVFTPAIEQAAAELNSTRLIATLAYSIYVLGLAFGCPFAAPLSETFGRRPVIFISLPIFSLFILGTGFAQSISSLVVLRFFAGFFASPSLSMGSGTLSDIWPPEKRSGPMSLYVATPFFGPALGPILGAIVTQARAWRWTAWLILFFTVVLVLAPAPFFVESFKPVLLRKRAKQRNLPLPLLPTEGMSWPKVIHTYATRTLTRPMHMLFTEPIVATFNTYSAFNFGVLYAFFAAFPYVFEREYGFDSISTGLTFLGLGVGVLIASVGIVSFTKLYYIPRVRKAVVEKQPPPPFATSKLKPEKRLPLAMAGGPILTIGLFLFGWSAAYRVHWIVPTIAEALFGLGNMLVFMACMMYITDTYGPLYSASAMASNAILRYVLGAFFPLFAVQMFQHLGTQWACTLLGCLSVLGACIPFVLVKYGEALRSRSGYKRNG